MTNELHVIFSELNIPKYSQDRDGNCRHACTSLQIINGRYHMVCEFCDAIDPDENDE